MSKIIRISEFELYVQFSDGGVIKLPKENYKENFYVGEDIYVSRNGLNVQLKKVSFFDRIKDKILH